jgi:DNA-binding XRE family transcriptional regulator
MKIKELKRKLRKDPRFLKAEKDLQWDIKFHSGRAVFFILMESELTQTQLAKKAGVLQSSISRAECEGCQLSFLNKLAKAAGLRIEIKVLKANQ